MIEGNRAGLLRPKAPMQMGSHRRVIVFFDGPEEEAHAHEALDPDAQWFNGVAQGTAGTDGVATLIAAGLTVEVTDASGEGVDPPADWLGTGLPAPRDVAVKEVGATADQRGEGVGSSQPRRRVYLGGLIGGLTAAAGTLVLLQQSSLIDPTPVIGSVGLALGALVGFLLVALVGQRSKSSAS
jgi:hypothetical protein